jgi:ribosomal protein S18 acetylase RimI-like enzyme
MLRFVISFLFFSIVSFTSLQPLNPPKKINQTFELHEYYNCLAEKIDQVSSEDRECWFNFLKKVEGKIVIFPDGYHGKIETAILRERLAGKKPLIHCELLDSPANNEWEQICKIQRESFDTQSLIGENCYQREKHIRILKDHFNHGHRFLIARNEVGEIVGVLEYCFSGRKNEIYIYSLSRKASYSKCGIGADLLCAFKKMAKGQWDCFFLHVRASNPALAFYESHGFEKMMEIPSYYRYPEESAYLMQCHLP